MTIPKVLLKPKRAQPFYARHPWVYVGAIERIDGSPADGDEVELLSSTGNFIARGLFNSQSKIQVRLFSWDADQSLDRDFFRSRLERAIGLRRELLKLDGPNRGWRVVFSEADYLSGMVVDKYGDWLTLQFTSLALANRREMIADLLQELLTPRGIYLRTEKGIGKLEGLTLHDQLLRGEPPPADLAIEENGLRFFVNLAEGQKTGYYLDQRDNRLEVARLCEGKRVLDAFCYTAGFGLHAVKAGAKSVACVDASQAAIDLAQRNVTANGLDRLTFTTADVFKNLTERAAAGETFDVLVLDPPKFARNRAALPEAIKGYRRLATLSMKLLSRDGILVFCCCTGLVTMEMLAELLAQVSSEAKRDLQILERRGPAPDHPVSAACLESGYLKCIIGRVG